MLETISVYYELLKLGNSRKYLKEIDTFLRANIIRGLLADGWAEYLDKPHTKQEIANNFNYPDEQFLTLVLNTLVKDDTLIFDETTKTYVFQQPINSETCSPKIFSEQMQDIWINYGKFMPKRLRGEYFDFASGINLLNWDNALATNMYAQLRKAAFASIGKFKHNASFLDIGSGNGYNTTSIWIYFKENYKNSNIKITGLEIDNDLIVIAEEEFNQMAEQINKDIYFKFQNEQESFPNYVQGDIVSIPFEDKTFDYVYASQVLHWADAKKAVEEMLRVTKPGGIVFGTQNFPKDKNTYYSIYANMVKGSSGFFSKEKMTEWATNAGAKKVDFITSASIFKIEKN